MKPLSVHFPVLTNHIFFMAKETLSFSTAPSICYWTLMNYRKQVNKSQNLWVRRQTLKKPCIIRNKRWWQTTEMAAWSRFANRRLGGGKCRVAMKPRRPKSQIGDPRRPRREIYTIPSFSCLGEALSLETLHWRKLRWCHMATWSRQGRMGQQRAIIKEVKRHIQLNHQSNSFTTDKITQ